MRPKLKRRQRAGRVGRSGRALRRALFLNILAFIAAPGAAPAASAPLAETPVEKALYHDGPSGRFLLDGIWHRRADPADVGLAARYQRRSSLSGWTGTSVPNAANAGDFTNESYLGSVWWYRKDFRAPAARPGARWLLRFESANYRATVWLNGRLLGEHAGAYVPFELEARRLRRRTVNRLVIRIDSRRGPFDVPPLTVRRSGRYVGGWWNYAGLLREVYLRRIESFDLRNVVVRPRLPCPSCAASVDVRATVANLGRRSATSNIEGHLAGLRLPFRRIVIPAGGRHRLHARVSIPRPRLWSPASPNLYRLALVARDREGTRLQRYTVHTGIRRLTLDGGGRLLINFKPVALRGANLHDDDPVRGAALLPADIEANMALLRDLGATMTRSHYPLHPLALELADRYGIVVWSEVPVYQMQDRLFRFERVRRQSIALVKKMIRRDLNHPSIVVWSLGNENTSQPGVGFERYVRDAKRLVDRLDPTRLVGLAFPGYPTVGKQELYTELDALGVNDYFGWYSGPANSIVDRAALGPYLNLLHATYPKQALFVTEFGAEANRDGPMSEKGTFEFQTEFLAYHLSVLAATPFVNGALVWILRDFRVKPGYAGGNPTPQPPWNNKGLVDDSGQRKPAFEVVREALRELRGDAE